MSQIIYELQDMTHLSWSRIRHSSGTAGSFLKSYEESPRGKIYYKLSSYDAFRGVTGHECVNEIIVDRLLSVLGIPHLSYQLINANIIIDDKPIQTWLCSSPDFKQRGESKIALDAYYQAERLPGESQLEFCIRNGWEEAIYQMLVVDYLILNRDRHGANVEVLRNRYRKSIRLAPLFDHGLSLLCRCEDDEAFEKADILEDKPIQCFVGSRSAYENLDLIPRGEHPSINSLKQNDKYTLVEGLDKVLPERWLDRIWEMIYERWQVYESIRDQR